MSGTGSVKPSEEQMLAWLALEGYQAYEGSCCVGVWRDDDAWWVTSLEDHKYESVENHTFSENERNIHYGVIWLGGVYDRPIRGLRKIYEHLIAKGIEL